MLGAKIRKKRTEKGMSLKDLAEKTDLTASFLSQVERGLAEPSITSLRKIAGALNVPIFYFLLDSESTSPIVRRNERKILRSPVSEITFELLSPDLNRKMEVMMANIETGASSCYEPLAHPGEEFIFVLQGCMEVNIGDEAHLLHEGDSIYLFAEIPHKLCSVGKEDLIIISAITPPRF